MRPWAAKISGHLRKSGSLETDFEVGFTSGSLRNTTCTGVERQGREERGRKLQSHGNEGPSAAAELWGGAPSGDALALVSREQLSGDGRTTGMAASLAEGSALRGTTLRTKVPDT